MFVCVCTLASYSWLRARATSQLVVFYLCSPFSCLQLTERQPGRRLLFLEFIPKTALLFTQGGTLPGRRRCLQKLKSEAKRGSHCCCNVIGCMFFFFFFYSADCPYFRDKLYVRFWVPYIFDFFFKVGILLNERLCIVIKPIKTCSRRLQPLCYMWFIINSS